MVVIEGEVFAVCQLHLTKRDKRAPWFQFWKESHHNRCKFPFNLLCPFNLLWRHRDTILAPQHVNVRTKWFTSTIRVYPANIYSSGWIICKAQKPPATMKIFWTHIIFSKRILLITKQPEYGSNLDISMACHSHSQHHDSYTEHTTTLNGALSESHHFPSRKSLLKR